MVNIRTAWKGAFSFSLFSVAVKLGGATGDKQGDIELHQFAPDGGKLRWPCVVEATGEEISRSSTISGYETADGSLVFLTDADFEEAYGKASREAKILTFTDAASVPDIAKAKPFLVQPDTGGERVYALLVRALQRTGKIAILEIGIRQRKRLAVVSATADGYLLLEQLVWAADIRKQDFPAPKPTFSETEEKIAIELIDTLSDPNWDYHAQRDDSQEKLNALVNSRIAAGETVGIAAPAGESSVTQAGDLLARLTAALEESKAAVAAKAAPVTAPRKRAPRKAAVAPVAAVTEEEKLAV